MTNDFFRIFRRPFAVTLCAVAGLSLAACGGGGETGANDSRLDSKVPPSEQQAPAGGEVTTPPQKSVGSPSTPDDNASDPVDESPAGNDDPDQGGSDPIVDGSDEPAEENNDPADGGELLPEDPLEELVSVVKGTVSLEWYRPIERENGDAIIDGEIEGYELRYRQVGEEQYKSEILKGEWVVEVELENLDGSYHFAVAAYDTEGLYSEFVSLAPTGQ